MNTPGFTAQASLNKKSDYYVSPLGLPIVHGGPPVRPASFSAIHHFPFPIPGPMNVCSACVCDCISKIGDESYCRLVCSLSSR